MIVTSQKIPNDSIPENACRKCDGVGKIQMVPYGRTAAFETTCHYCNGEKVLSKDLIDRKALGATLKLKLHESDLTIREASKKFGGEFRSWNDALHGKLSLEEIEAKINLIGAQEAKA